MKKLTFSIFAATLAFGANADVEQVDAAVASRCTYDGFFFGLGVSAVDAGVKTETTDANGVNETGTTAIQKFDTGASIGGYIDKFRGDIGIDTNDHDTRFTGNAMLGYGKRIKEKAYIALEAGLDVGQSSNFHHAGIATTEGKTFEVVSKNHSFIPSAALRLGYIHPETKTMIYLKAGASYSQAKTTYTDNYDAGYELDGDAVKNNGDMAVGTKTYSGKCSKWTPIVALGFEKVTGKNFRTRAEFEYRFQTTRSFDYSNKGETEKWKQSGADIVLDKAPSYYGTVKLYNKAAITLRIMGIYTVK